MRRHIQQIGSVAALFSMIGHLKAHLYGFLIQSIRVRYLLAMMYGLGGIMEGVRIADGAIVAARAVVSQDVKPCIMVGSIPARVISE